MPRAGGGLSVGAVVGIIVGVLSIVSVLGGFAYRNGLLIDKAQAQEIAKQAVLPAQVAREKGDLQLQLILKEEELEEIEALEGEQTLSAAEQRRKASLLKQIDAINDRLDYLQKEY